MRKATRRLVSVSSLILALLLAVPVLSVAAQEGGLTFEQPEDVILHWAERACILILLLSAAIIAYVLLFRRDRLMMNSSKWLLFLGLCVLPLPAALLSAGVGMEGSKATEFCHSCHEPMDPFVEDMMDPESEHLAAVHYKNKLIQHEHCWNCHSDYGISGTAEAKFTGLIHIWKYTTDTWEAPIKLYNDYRWTICLECHAGAGYFEAPRNDPEAHEGVLDLVLSGEFSCTDCHESSHPPREERSTRP